jgi:hypothetical protein
MPTAIHNLREAVTEFAEPRNGDWRSGSGWVAQSERVSCICLKATRRAACPSGSRSARPMWSRAEAAKRGICGYFRATSSYRAASASILWPISAVRQPPVPVSDPGTAAKDRPKRAEKVVQPELKKLWPLVEPPADMAVEYSRRAKPPSPSPSITRRRTPVALAAGVHLLFERSRSPFLGHCRNFRPVAGTRFPGRLLRSKLASKHVVK